jgi:glucoamylase
VARRQFHHMTAGKTLRITSADRFQVVWSVDNWQSTRVLDSTQLGYAGSYADILTAPEQSGGVSFTLFWPEENRWEGRNFDVALEPPA